MKVFIGDKFIGLHRALGGTGAHPNIMAHRLIKSDYSKTIAVRGSMLGIENNALPIKRKAIIGLQPWFEKDPSKRIKVHFWILPKSGKWNPILPERDISCDEISNKLEPVLADPLFWKAQPISMLLNVGTWISFLNDGSKKLSDNLLCQESKFGRVISGQLGNDVSIEPRKGAYVNLVQDNSYDELRKTMQRFWAFEDIALCTKRDADHELVEQIFQRRHYRDETGRFFVAIPLNPNIKEIGSSREIAKKRFFMLEKRFERDSEFKQKYIEFMRECEQLGHMSEATKELEPDSMVYYIPHHGVVTSGKFKVVFDASCKTNLNLSLNDIQLVGEKLQCDLYEQIMRFRRHLIGIIKCLDK